MTDIVVRAVMTADGTGLVNGAKEAQSALDSLKASHSGLSDVARKAANDTGEFGRVTKDNAMGAYELDRALLHLGGTFGYHTLEVRRGATALHELVEGLGLANAGALALGAGFIFTIGQTALFKTALGGVWDTLKEGVEWFDKLVSSKARWDAAQAKDSVASFDPLGDQKGKLAAIASLDAAINDQYAAGGSSMSFGNRNIARPGYNPKLMDEMLRTRAALYDQVFPEIKITPGSFSGGGGPLSAEEQRAQDFKYKTTAFWEDGSPNDFVKDPVTGMWVSAGASSNKYARSDIDQMFADSNDREIKRPFRLGGFPASNSRDVVNWGSDSKVRGDLNGQRVLDAGATRQEISKIELEGAQRDGETTQQLMDKIHQQNVQRMDDLRTSFEDFGTSAVLNFKTAGQAALDFSKQLATIVIQTQIMRPLAQSLFGATGTTGGGLAGDFFSRLFGSSGELQAIPDFSGDGRYHTGGIVGIDGSRWRNAPRFHSGGIAGDEVPIVAQKGEGIFTPAQMAALGKGMSPSVTVNVHNNGGGNARVQQGTDANGNLQFDVLIDQVDAALADRTQRGASQMGRVMQNSFGLSRSP